MPKINVLFLVFALIIAAAHPTLAKANDWSIVPFALYEHATDPIIIDGVSTKYNLGVFGTQVRYGIDKNFNVSGSIGYGENNNQDVSFSGANFNGKVSGLYLQASGTKNVFALNKTNFALEGAFTWRDLKANNLVGSRNGLALTGSSESTITSLDTSLNIRHLFTDKLFATLGLGYSYWSINADATAFFSSNGIRANANKKIDTEGFDPIYKLGFGYNSNSKNFTINLGCRSLRSKTSSNIITGQAAFGLKF